MTKTTTAVTATPAALRNRFRERLIEDLFVDFYKHIASEDTLRSMAVWITMMNIFSDDSIIALWNKQPSAHSSGGKEAIDKWSRLNKAAVEIADEVKVDAEH